MSSTLSFVALLAACSVPALASERAISCKALPSAVQQKADSIVAGGTIHHCVKDGANYELETVKDGRSRDVTVDARGDILEVEQQVDQSEIPGPVAEALKKAGGSGSIGKIESLTQHGRLISYETTITRNGRRHEVAFRPDGSPTHAD